MISGKTKIFYMVAHPIDHVRTPEVMNPLFEARGIDAIMVPVHMTPEDFRTGWAAFKRAFHSRSLPMNSLTKWRRGHASLVPPISFVELIAAK